SIEDEGGRRVARMVVPTTPEGIERALARYVDRGLRVAIEAGGQTAWIHDVLGELGVKRVHVVHPLKVKWIAESKKKTDRVDAELLAHLLRIGGLPEPVHMPRARSREVRGLLQARRQLVQMRTKLINVVRGLLRQQRITLKARALQSGRGWQRLQTLPLSGGVREIVGAYEATVQMATQALAALERQLQARAERDGRVRRLESIPGVGPVTAQTLVATVDRIGRFARAKKLVAYAGLAPSVRASGERVEHGRITKQGRSELRAVLVQAAHAVLAVKAAAAAPLQRWHARVARRRGKKTALVALARKLLTIAFHLLREGTIYDPGRVRCAA
ncbi:MAG TPA: IS110 family transposase, partial [Methylomirabilota bacterium]|nr:IS110 family transposase [Methylomirabilota bacterium]